MEEQHTFYVMFMLVRHELLSRCLAHAGGCGFVEAFDRAQDVAIQLSPLAPQHEVLQAEHYVFRGACVVGTGNLVC